MLRTLTFKLWLSWLLHQPQSSADALDRARHMHRLSRILARPEQ